LCPHPEKNLSALQRCGNGREMNVGRTLKARMKKALIRQLELSSLKLLE